jgi:hypothetical protein
VRGGLLALAGATAAAVATSTAAAAPREVVAPGLVYERVVRPGPIIAHVLRLDRYPARRVSPDGPAYRVEALAGGPLTAGRTRLSSMVAARASTGAVAGINGDYFSWSGVPTGLLLNGAGLVRDPAPFRSSAVLDDAGVLHVSRLGLRGTLVGLGPAGAPAGAAATIGALNRLARAGGGETVLYTPAFGRRTPPAPGTPSLVLAPSDPAAPVVGSVTARVLAMGGAGGIGLDGRLVVALGGARAQALASSLRPGDPVRVELAVPGIAPGAVAGIGGGPALVAGGRPAVAPEGFAAAQTAARTARSAVGQRADGTLLLVSVEDGRAGPSRGVTAAELARLMAGLGAEVAMGLDSGGSAGLSLRGQRPASAGPAGERAIASALIVSYRGVQVAPVAPGRVSPNGDGVGETAAVAYRLTARSAVRADLVGPRGRRVARLGAGWRRAGVHRVRVPARARADGRYRVRVVARGADDRRPTRAARAVVVDRTLGHLRLGGRGGAVALAFRLSRPARVSVRVRVPGGWRTALAGARLGRGGRGLRVAAPPGRRGVRVTARSRLGPSTLAGTVRVPRR